ncbi:unnamed protein product, partial [Choristocarpus tenellus]
MKFPPVFLCINSSLFTGDEGFLLLIRRLRYPGHLVDLEEEFGIEYSQLSHLFKTVMDWIWQTHGHRIQDNIGFFAPFFPQMGAATERKGGVAVSSISVEFLDGTLWLICRPVGPMELDLQREVYDGHHKAHGLGFQSVEFPDGMIGDLYGPL